MRIAVVALLVAALLGGAWAYRQERNDRREDVARLEGQLRAVEGDLAGTRRANAVLAARIRAVTRRALKAKLARTELAARVRRSVFTVTAALDEGTGWVAWVHGRNSYVLTATTSSSSASPAATARSVSTRASGSGTAASSRRTRETTSR
jgi:hypothetical protein